MKNSRQHERLIDDVYLDGDDISDLVNILFQITHGHDSWQEIRNDSSRSLYYRDIFSLCSATISRLVCQEGSEHTDSRDILLKYVRHLEERTTLASTEDEAIASIFNGTSPMLHFLMFTFASVKKADPSDTIQSPSDRIDHGQSQSHITMNITTCAFVSHRSSARISRSCRHGCYLNFLQGCGLTNTDIGRFLDLPTATAFRWVNYCKDNHGASLITQ